MGFHTTTSAWISSPKSLPIRPVAMACGETVVVVMLLALLQWSVFAATAIFIHTAAAEMLIAGLFALPFNWILCGMENFLFLLYPSPRVATGSEGFLKMGRLMLFMLAKFLVLGSAAPSRSDPGGGRLFADRERRWRLASSAGWRRFVPALGVILLLIAWAFQRDDVSRGVSE